MLLSWWTVEGGILVVFQAGTRDSSLLRNIQTDTGHYPGRIKLFGAPRQWKIFRPLFQAVFLSGGGITPQTESNATPLSPKTVITNILYIEFVAADLLFRLARMRHAWKGDCYLTVLVLHGRYYFYSLKFTLMFINERKRNANTYLISNFDSLEAAPSNLPP